MDENVIPIFRDKEARQAKEGHPIVESISLIPSPSPQSPAIRLLPGTRMELGEGCLYLFYPYGSDKKIRTVWISYLENLAKILLAKGVSFEILTTRDVDAPGGVQVPDKVRINLLAKSAECMPPA